MAHDAFCLVLDMRSACFFEARAAAGAAPLASKRHPLLAMTEKRFEAVSQAGTRVVVLWRPKLAEVEVRVGSDTYLPAWGSQACDDWLDWMAAEQQGDSTTLPVDADDWLRDEGYHRR